MPRWCQVGVALLALTARGQSPFDPSVPAPAATPAPAESAPANGGALPSSTGADSAAPAPGNGVSPEPPSAQLFRDASPDTENPPDNPQKTNADAEVQAQYEQANVDAYARITFERAETNAEALFNGIGGVPQALNPLYNIPGLQSASGYKIGPFLIRPILSAGVNYGTASGNRNGSFNGFYGTISPAFTLFLGDPERGRTIGMEYTGSLNFGNTSAGSRLYDQSLSMTGAFSFTKLNLGFGLDFSQLSGSDRDFGGSNVNREIIGLSLSGSYTYSEKTSFSSTLSAPIRLFGQGTDSEGVNSTTFFNYAYSPLTTIGVGVSVGTLVVSQETTQVFEQLLGRFSYILTQKVTFSGTGGLEFLRDEVKEQITPVFGFGLAYQVREGTALAMNAERRIENSAAISGTNYTDTNVSVSLTQRLGDIFQFTGTAGYENADYTGVVRGVSSNREDNQLILQGSLSARIREHFVLTGIISYAKDFSNQDAFSSLQNSLQLSYVF